MLLKGAKKQEMLLRFYIEDKFEVHCFLNIPHCYKDNAVERQWKTNDEIPHPIASSL